MSSHHAQSEPIPHREVAVIALAVVVAITTFGMQAYLGTMAAFLAAIALLLHMALGQRPGLFFPVFNWERTLIRVFLLIPILTLFIESVSNNWENQRLALPFLVIFTEVGVWLCKKDESPNKDRGGD